MTISGTWESRFQSVVDAFELNFTERRDVGAALAVYHQGAKVVDVWAGEKNTENKIAWQEETLAPVFSVTKALTALCFLILASKKKFDYDRTVQSYWPEFSLRGKGAITCRELLEHRAGLYALDTPLSLADFRDRPQKVYDALIFQKPHFAPGQGQAYGAQVWGIYTAELFKRVQGESLQEFFTREITRKLKVACYLGLPEALDNRVATLYPVSTSERIRSAISHLVKGNTTEGRIARAFIFGNKSIKRAYLNPDPGKQGLGVFNESWVYRLGLPWAGGITTARALAAVFHLLADEAEPSKPRFVDRTLLREVTRENALRYDLVLQKPLGWNLGFLKEEIGLYSPNVEAFGHSGMGGPVVVADPKARLSFAYVCNKMDTKLRPEKTLRLCKAVYAAIHKT